MNDKKRGYIYLLCTFPLWGSLYIAAKYALAVVPPVTVLMCRYLLSVVILYFVLKKKGMRKIEKKDLKYFVIIGGMGYFFSIACQLIGTNLLDASLASLINSMNPIFIPILAFIFLKERITVRKVISVVVSIAGIYVILGTGSQPLNVYGLIASMFSVLFWAATSVIIRKVSGRYDPVQISFVGMLFALCFNIPAAAVELSMTPFSLNLSAVAALIYMAAACTALGHTLWNKSLQLLPASTCSMLYPLQPLTSAVLGVLLLHETITTSFIVGALCICAGIIIAVRE